MSLFSEIERAIESGFRRWTEKMFGKAEADDLILVYRALMGRLETRIERTQRGGALFPYNHVSVRLSTPDEHRRATYTAAFVQDDRLQSDVREFLTRSGCEVPRGFCLDTEILEAPNFSIDVACDMRAARTPAQSPRRARLVVISGNAGEAFYDITKARTNIGRLPVLLDRDQRPVRRNEIAFDEGSGDVNATVSRSHAHLRHDAVSGEYRICDDGSEYGTRVFRDGRAIEVPAGSTRGERLQPGDEIYFGRACVRFEVDSENRD